MLRQFGQRGAAAVEFHIVALFALLPMCLGILQMCLLMVDNHHLDHAAFLAAREAAVTHGDIDAARRAFARGASVLFVSAATPVDRANVVTRVATAYAAAVADTAQFATVRVLSPTADAAADFSIQRNGGRVIPNDALDYRAMVRGARSGITLQQANVLKIEVNYCRHLIVPFASQLLLATLRAVDRDPWRRRCYAAGRVPIRSEGITPMQSDFRVSS
jgi:hypothetical protein